MCSFLPASSYFFPTQCIETVRFWIQNSSFTSPSQSIVLSVRYAFHSLYSLWSLPSCYAEICIKPHKSNNFLPSLTYPKLCFPASQYSFLLCLFLFIIAQGRHLTTFLGLFLGLRDCSISNALYTKEKLKEKAVTTFRHRESDLELSRHWLEGSCLSSLFSQ